MLTATPVAGVHVKVAFILADCCSADVLLTTSGDVHVRAGLINNAYRVVQAWARKDYRW